MALSFMGDHETGGTILLDIGGVFFICIHICLFSLSVSVFMTNKRVHINVNTGITITAINVGLSHSFTD